MAQAAETLTSYSPAYLKLRILQGKLQGKKIGRNWFIKKSWLEKYIELHGHKEGTAAASCNPEKTEAEPMAQLPPGESLFFVGSRNLKLAICNFLSVFRFLNRPLPSVNRLLSASRTLPLAALKSVRNNFRTAQNYFSQLLSQQRLTKILSAALVLTIFFTLAAPTKTWARWGQEYGEQVKKAMALSARGLAQAADLAATGIKSTLALARLEDQIDSIVSTLREKPLILRLSRLAGLADSAAATKKSGAGQVAGEIAARDNQPPIVNRETRSLFSKLLSPLQPSFSLLDPSSPSSLVSRLSGRVIEAGSILGGQAGQSLASVINFSSSLNLGKILQPAGSFLASLRAQRSNPLDNSGIAS